MITIMLQVCLCFITVDLVCLYCLIGAGMIGSDIPTHGLDYLITTCMFVYLFLIICVVVLVMWIWHDHEYALSKMKSKNYGSGKSNLNQIISDISRYQ